MPALKQKISEAAWGLRAFLSQRVAPTRAKGTKDPGSSAGTGDCDIRSENIIWMFGTARTGSTWLAFMMEDLEDHTVWREPYVGELFGRLYYNWVGEKHSKTKHFILAERQK